MKRNLFVLIIALVFSAVSLVALDGYWEKQNNVPSFGLQNHWLDIFFLESDPNYGWICGMDGRVIYTTDGGENWRTSSTRLATRHLERIMFIDTQIGFCSGPVNQNNPAGIYKTNNGGKTWITITPDNLFTLNKGLPESAWSCYFTDSMNGLFFGGSCETDSIYIWKTTNGGMNWHTFSAYCPDNRVCDGWIESPNGHGYAISSSVLWETNDGGYTWDTLSVTGSPRHQEEFHKQGDFILIPWAGVSCAGGLGNDDGGVIYSHDGGRTWNGRDFGSNMYGTTILNEKEAWSAGSNGNLNYTNNGGFSWFEMACGTVHNDLDDVFFIGDSIGWAVGKDAVYKLVPPRKTISKNEIVFDPTCIGDRAYDTLMVANHSFFPWGCRLSQTGNDTKDLELIKPAVLNFNIPACDSVEIVFEYNPTTMTVPIETWQVEIDGDIPVVHTFTVTGTPTESTAEPEMYKIYDSIYCNTNDKIALKWNTDTDMEYVYEIHKNEGDPRIQVGIDLPFYMKQNKDNYFYFKAAPQDTGWIDAEFEIFTNPCDHGNEVELFIYGVSSIIEADQNREFTADCYDDYYDTLKIENHGNYELNIDSVFVTQDGALIELVGFENEESMATKIGIRKFKNFIYKFKDGIDGAYDAEISFVNNDSTKINGNKNPYSVTVLANRNRTNLSLVVDTLDFGSICAGERYFKNFRIDNNGYQVAKISEPIGVENELWATEDQYGFPFDLRHKEGKTIRAYLETNKSGRYEGILRFQSSPCNEEITLVVVADVVISELTTQPEIVEESFPAHEPYKFSVRLTNTGDTDLNIISMDFSKKYPGLKMNITPNVSPQSPVSIPAGQGQFRDFEFEMLADRGIEIKDNLEIECSGICPLDFLLPVDIEIRDRQLYKITDTLDFGKILCDEGLYEAQAEISNASKSADTLTLVKIEPSNSPFRVAQKSPPNIIIDKESSMLFDITFNAQNDAEGKYEANLIIKSIGDDGQTLAIPIIAEYRRTVTKPKYSDKHEGKIDTCVGIREYHQIYKNEGSEPDSLIISYNTELGNIWTEPAQYLIIPPKDSAEFIGYIDYGAYTEYKKYTETFKLESQVCHGIHNYDVNFSICKPITTLKPDNISYTAWAGHTETHKFTIENNSGVDFTVTEFENISKNVDFNFDITPPFDLADNATQDVNVTYTGISDFQAIDTILVKSSLNCEEIRPLVIHVDSPLEHYVFDLDLDKKEIKIDSTDYITLSLKKAVPMLSTEKIYFQFSFNPNVAKPEKIYFNKGNEPFEEISFSHNNGTINGEIEGDFLNDIFKKAQPLLKIQFRGLASNPDTTTVWIDDFNPVPEKPVTYEKVPGFLEIYGYCAAEVIYGQLAPIPNYEVKGTYVDGNHLALNLLVMRGQLELDMTLLDISGKSYGFAKETADIGERTVRFDISNVPNGAYILRLNSNKNQQKTLKIMIIK